MTDLRYCGEIFFLKNLAIRFAACLGILLIPMLAHAIEIEPFTCRNGLFPTEQRSLQIARFNGLKGQKLFFYQDDNGCPFDEGRCRRRDYIVAGDEFLVNKVVGAWACAWYNGKKHETVGWVKTDDLKFLPVENEQDFGRWCGIWRYYNDPENYIAIIEKGPSLHVTGEATWHGGTAPSGEPIIHIGNLDGFIKPSGNRAELKDDNDCVANFTLLGEFLVVTDNGNCGGMNVRFANVYTKSK